MFHVKTLSTVLFLKAGTIFLIPKTERDLKYCTFKLNLFCHEIHYHCKLICQLMYTVKSARKVCCRFLHRKIENSQSKPILLCPSYLCFMSAVVQWLFFNPYHFVSLSKRVHHFFHVKRLQFVTVQPCTKISFF